MERKSMGSFIAALRRAKGLTQRELAEKLNVSDKTVSRWERDEGSPELSLIPVIAEIFGVTCDELLRGARSAAQEPGREEPQKAEKQRLRLLALSLSKFKSRSCIAAGLSGCGLIAALVGNFAFLRAYLGFFIGALFFLGAAVVEAVWLNAAFFAVSGQEFASFAGVNAYKHSLIRMGKWAFGLILVLFAATLPLIVFVRDPYQGLKGAAFLQYGLLFILFACLLCGAAGYFLNHFLLKKGVYTLDEKGAAAYAHNFRLKRRCALLLLCMLFLSGLANGAAIGFGDTSRIAKGTTFDSLEAFKAFMEQDVPADYPLYGESAPDSSIEYYDASGNVIGEGEAPPISITDSQGNVLCSYIPRNRSVWLTRYGSGEDSLPITVFTYGQINAARERARIINAVFIALYLLEILGVLLLYWRKRVK